jgi:NADPH2:quinone reductase
MSTTHTESMRAAVLREEGKPDVVQVEQVEIPVPGPGDVRVRVRYASLNHLDVWIRKGMPSVPKPRIMGADGMGHVDAVGAGVDESLVGRKVLIEPSVCCGECTSCLKGETQFCQTFAVLGEHRAGTHAEYVVVPARNVHEIPAHLDDAAAAALPLVYCTAWRMLFTRARLTAEERVLVWGATAGVGSAAVQLAHHAGAEVIATTRRLETDDHLRALGADHVVETSADAVVPFVRELVGKAGIDVVFDHLGAVAWEPSLQVLAKGGRLVTCGATTGPHPPAGITRIFWKQLSILGSTMASQRDFRELLAFVALHGISPRVDRVFGLSQVAEAHAYLETAQQVGKVVLDVDA